MGRAETGIRYHKRADIATGAFPRHVDPEVYNYLTNENIEEINKYIEAPMTATYFSKEVTKL